MTTQLLNPLDAALAAARREGRGALIPYLTGGYPDRDEFVDLAVALLEAGADALEIGIPFSDPLLDGPSIQRSQYQALQAGTTPRDCLTWAAEIRARSGKPVLFMGAFNPIHAIGMGDFCRAAQGAGVTGLIVPDLPSDEAKELRAAAVRHDVHLIQMAAPTSTDERLDRVAAQATGFIYCISVAGITGARASVTDTARPLVERVRARTDVPVLVGFGIGTPDAAAAVAEFADGAIVGSALIDLLSREPAERRVSAASVFVGELAEGLTRPSSAAGAP